MGLPAIREVLWLAKVNGDGRYDCLVVAGIDYNIPTQSQRTTNIVKSGLNIESGVCSIVIYVQGYIISVFFAVSPSR